MNIVVIGHTSSINAVTIDIVTSEARSSFESFLVDMSRAGAFVGFVDFEITSIQYSV